mmetsp:Transcript_47913/g.137526  ORF Transcript_47913/g.137526 Transcript_47913/m.137526 type:complete len:182 (-) Transcript_47913:55-600(-)
MAAGRYPLTLPEEKVLSQRFLREELRELMFGDERPPHRSWGGAAGSSQMAEVIQCGLHPASQPGHAAAAAERMRQDVAVQAVLATRAAREAQARAARTATALSAAAAVSVGGSGRHGAAVGGAGPSPRGATAASTGTRASGETWASRDNVTWMASSPNFRQTMDIFSWDCRDVGSSKKGPS